MVRGSRIIDSPGARMLTMVVTKLRPPMVKDAMKSTIPTIHRVCPVSEPGTAPLSAESGGYEVQPPAAAPAPTKNEVMITMQAGRNVQ